MPASTTVEPRRIGAEQQSARRARSGYQQRADGAHLLSQPTGPTLPPAAGVWYPDG